MEIYLTRMKLNPLSKQVRREIGNLQELHKTISSAFPAVENQAHLKHHERITPRNKFDILHRLEIDTRRGEIVLLVQSTVKPDWNKIKERTDFLADAEEDLSCKEIGAIYEAIENGMDLRFRLHANPTKRVGKSDTKADSRFKPTDMRDFRRRVEIIGDENETREEKLIKWLSGKGEVKIEKDKKTGGGFRLASVSVKETVENVGLNVHGKVRGEKANENDKNKPHRLTFSSVVFEGILQVTAAEKFREALQKGIGSGKSYGFGLLSIAKSQNA